MANIIKTDKTGQLGDSVGMQINGSPTDRELLWSIAILLKRKAHPRTSQPGTCLWCGKKLRLARSARLFNTAHRGHYGDNAFCTLRCGYCFGVGMAKLGKRFADGWDYFTPSEDPQ